METSMFRLTRRDLIAGLGGAIAATGIGGRLEARAADAALLRVVKRNIEVMGKSASVYAIENSSGGHGLDVVLGDPFRVRLENHSNSETLVHWHGLTPPSGQDGVPMLSQAPLQPGQAYDYDFPLTKSGTHWMHSHFGLQEQQMLAAPLIVRETAEPVFDEQEHVVLLHDFTFRDPAEILAELKGGGGAHAGHAGMESMEGMDHTKMAADDDMGGAMLNDVVFDAYLANDRTLDDPEVVKVEKGGQVRLRIINAAAASNMWIDTGTLQAELIAVDGHAVHPVGHTFFPLAIAQRADLRLRIPSEGGAFPIMFRPEGVAGRAGIILATAGATVMKQFGVGLAPPPLDLSFERRLRAVAQLPQEPVTRSEVLMLTGGGADYLWGFNGKPSMHETLMTVRQGERIEVMMHNMTSMAHPMHLHGHYFKVTAIGGQRFDGAVRDTVLVPPMESVTIMFDADNPGTWAFHCHHLYHMNSGMMGTLAYSSPA